MIAEDFAVRVIRNPAAGGGAGRTEDLLRGSGIPRPEVVVTGRRGGVRRAAREWREGLLVVAGGDGTLNEAVNGLAEAGFPAGVTLALLPAGTGNDLSRTLGIPHDPRRAWEAIRAGRERTLDVARARSGAGETFFVNAAIGGMGAEVSEAAANGGLKGRWKGLTYLRASLGTARKFRAHDVELTLDGAGHRLRALSVAVGNCRYAGGGRLAAPRANPEDGLLDVVAIEGAGMREILALAPTALSTPDYLDEDGVFFARAGRVEVEAPPPGMKFNSDGEVLGRGPVEFSVVPGALRVVVGPGYDPYPQRPHEARGADA